MRDLRDYCCWRKCSNESDLIFYGAGLCDKHFELAASTHLGVYAYAIDRVTDDAAATMNASKRAATTHHQPKD